MRVPISPKVAQQWKPVCVSFPVEPNDELGELVPQTQFAAAWFANDYNYRRVRWIWYENVIIAKRIYYESFVEFQRDYPRAKFDSDNLIWM